MTTRGKTFLIDDIEVRRIPHRDGYAVSIDGIAFSQRKIGCTDWLKMTMNLKVKCRKHFYMLFGEGKPPFKWACELVMLAWGPPRPQRGCVVRHIDFNRMNNHVDNLRWTGIGEHVATEYRRNRSLTPKMVRLIRTRFASAPDMAKLFNVNTPVVTRVLSGRCYSWVQ